METILSTIGRSCIRPYRIPVVARAAWVWAATTLAFSLLTVGCVTMSGRSSGQMKRQLEDSFLFRSSYILFPSDNIGDGEPPLPQLTAAQIDETKKDITTFAAALAARHKAVRDSFSDAFGFPLDGADGCQIKVVDFGEPLAHTTPGKTIEIDVKVLQAVFRGAVARALTQGPSLSNPMQGSIRSPKLTIDELATGRLTEATQMETLRLFLEARTKVRTTAGHSLFDDLTQDTGSTGPDSPWFSMAELLIDSERVQRDYFGTLLFLLAHEQGHVVLRHISERAPKDPDERKNVELEADGYAFWLLATAVKGPVIPLVQSDQLKGAVGYDTFFKIAYSVAGFDGLEKIDQAGYPKREERLALLNALFKQYEQAMAKRFDQALIEAEARKAPNQGAK